jgi:RecB family exonuclease
MINTILEKPPHAAKTTAFADLIRVMDTPLESLTISRPLKSADEDLLPSPMWEYLTALFPEAAHIDDSKQTVCRRDSLLTISADSVPNSAVSARVLIGLAVAGKRRSGKDIWCSDLVRSIDTAQRVFKNEFGPNRYFSPSTLEQYINCPRQFFFEKLLNLGEPDIPEEDMSALDRGTLIHDVLHAFYRERLDRKSPRIAPEEIEQCAARIRDIAEEKFGAMQYSEEVARRQYRDIVGCPELNDEGMAVRFARLEAEGSPELQPNRLEWSLRDATHPFVLTDSDANDIRVSGKIDRMDTAGNDAVIWDYKTGHIPRRADIISFKSIQIGLYMLAAEHFLDHSVNAGGYYQLRNRCKPLLKTAVRRENSGISMFLPPKGKSNSIDREWPDNEYLDYMEQLKQTIGDAVGRIRRGDFHATDDIRVCTYCDFVGLCRRSKETTNDDV